ncbi:MAG TPA: HAD family phosphatase [Bryobacteraceae bacterium]|nr:HAD family phosphatase [Bryobacteraceae bacterium]
MPLHTEAWIEYLHRLGIASTAAEIEPRMHGRRNDDIVAEFISADLVADEIFAHGAAKESLYRDMMQSQLYRYMVPGIVEFLDRSRHVPLGVASNAEPANIDLVLDGLGLRDRFQSIANGHQVARPKPYPDVYLRAAELLGVAPRDCLVFEDSPPGIQAARAAGMQVVGVQTHSADLLNVDLAIRDFQDPKLEPWLRSHAAKTNESD